MMEGGRDNSAYGWFKTVGPRVEEWVDRVRRGGDCEFRAETETHGSVCVNGRKREGSIFLALAPDDGGPAMVVEFHDAADEPGSGYPVDLPFVPGLSSLIICPKAETRSGVLRVAVWVQVSEAESVIEEMARQGAEAGWSLASRRRLNVRMVHEDTSRQIYHLPLGPIRDYVFLMEMGGGPAPPG